MGSRIDSGHCNQDGVGCISSMEMAYDHNSAIFPLWRKLTMKPSSDIDLKAHSSSVVRSRSIGAQKHPRVFEKLKEQDQVKVKIRISVIVWRETNALHFLPAQSPEAGCKL